jgi:hypothetical protein
MGLPQHLPYRGDIAGCNASMRQNTVTVKVATSMARP